MHGREANKSVHACVACTLQTGAQTSFATNSPTIKENAVKNTVVGTIVASDPDLNAKLTFSLDDNAGGRFALDSASNVVCKAASASDPVSTGLCVLYIHLLILNLRTELFRPLWTRQRSTEEMRPNLIAMEIKISNQARTYLARVLKLTSQ